MGKTFVGVRRRKRKGKLLFFFMMFLFGLIVTFNYLDKHMNKISDKSFVNLLISSINLSDNQRDFVDIKIKDYINSNALLLKNYYDDIDVNDKEAVISQKEYTPLIYLYNSHQSEEYAASSFVEFTITPTVMMASYILEDIFNKNGYYSLVEEGSVKNVLNDNGWKYNSSYKASRILMENAFSEYKDLKYFIDIHRDSLSRERTYINIDGKDYAKTIFLIGLENENYRANLEFVEQINNKMNEKYPGLSKGIYKKGGFGVNGVYNQDFSPYTILIEIGGVDSTTVEVLNSAMAFADCFMEVIGDD